jgi:hypothetical protein
VLQIELASKGDISLMMSSGAQKLQRLKGSADDYTDIVDYIFRCTHEICEEHGIGLIYAFYQRDVKIRATRGPGDGHYAVTGGWGCLQGAHTGRDFLGVPATGKRVAMRVMDFCHCDDQTIVENRVPMDIPICSCRWASTSFAGCAINFTSTAQSVRANGWSGSRRRENHDCGSRRGQHRQRT